MVLCLNRLEGDDVGLAVVDFVCGVVGWFGGGVLGRLGWFVGKVVVEVFNGEVGVFFDYGVWGWFLGCGRGELCFVSCDGVVVRLVGDHDNLGGRSCCVVGLELPGCFGVIRGFVVGRVVLGFVCFWLVLCFLFVFLGLVCVWFGCLVGLAVFGLVV